MKKVIDGKLYNTETARKLVATVSDDMYKKIIEFANNCDYSVSKACRMLIGMGLDNRKKIGGGF